MLALSKRSDRIQKKTKKKQKNRGTQWAVRSLSERNPLKHGANWKSDNTHSLENVHVNHGSMLSNESHGVFLVSTQPLCLWGRPSHSLREVHLFAGSDPSVRLCPTPWHLVCWHTDAQNAQKLRNMHTDWTDRHKKSTDANKHQHFSFSCTPQIACTFGTNAGTDFLAAQKAKDVLMHTFCIGRYLAS